MPLCNNDAIKRFIFWAEKELPILFFNETGKDYNQYSIDSFHHNHISVINEMIEKNDIIEYLSTYYELNYLDSEIELAKEKILSEIGINIEKCYQIVRDFFECSLTNILFQRILNEECKSQDSPF